MREKHKDLINMIGTDPLSCNDLIETMESGDCMCIGLDVVRPETAIVDPTKVVIKQIIPTFMSADSFIDSSIFNVKKNDSSLGGFNKSS